MKKMTMTMPKEEEDQKSSSNNTSYKDIRMYLFTDDVLLINRVFAFTLRRNIFQRHKIELICRRAIEKYNIVPPRDSIIIDESLAQATDITIKDMESNFDLSSKFKVILSLPANPWNQHNEKSIQSSQVDLISKLDVFLERFI